MYVTLTPLFWTTLYAISPQGQKKIDSLSLYHAPQFQKYNDRLYFLDASTSKDSVDRNLQLCYYTIKPNITKSPKSFLDIGDAGCYFVLNDHVIWNSYSSHESATTKLECYSLTNGEKVTICDSIITFGVIHNQLAYLTVADNQYSLYLYDFSSNSSKHVRTFKCNLTTSSHLNYNFTSTQIVIQSTTNQIAVYNFEKDEMNYYTTDQAIDKFVAFDQYAFYTVYDPDYYGPTTEMNYNTLYRISLIDGSTEKLSDNYNIDSIFVTSDDDVYISARDNIQNPCQLIHCSSKGKLTVLFNM